MYVLVISLHKIKEYLDIKFLIKFYVYVYNLSLSAAPLLPPPLPALSWCYQYRSIHEDSTKVCCLLHRLRPSPSISPTHPARWAWRPIWRPGRQHLESSLLQHLLQRSDGEIPRTD